MRGGRPSISRLNRHHNRLLAGSTAARFAAAVFATEVGVIHLDAALEPLLLARDAHDLGELGLDLPGGRLRHPEAAAELDRGDALLGLRDEIHGAKPRGQRHLGRGEDGTGRKRRLPAAAVALMEGARSDDAVLPTAALGATETVRPAPARHRFAAPLFVAIKGHEMSLREALLKLDAIASHDHLPQIARRFAEQDGNVRA